MIVSFLDDKPVGVTLEPPKNPHITIKKKFKLVDLNEEDLIKKLSAEESIKGVKHLKLGGRKEHGDENNEVIEVLNPEVWQELHERIRQVLDSYIVSRDPHFENNNYLPHVTWKMNGTVNLDPKPYINKTFDVTTLYLIERVHPTESIAKILAKIKL